MSFHSGYLQSHQLYNMKFHIRINNLKQYLINFKGSKRCFDSVVFMPGVYSIIAWNDYLLSLTTINITEWYGNITDKFNCQYSLQKCIRRTVVLFFFYCCENFSQHTYKPNISVTYSKLPKFSVTIVIISPKKYLR